MQDNKFLILPLYLLLFNITVIAQIDDKYSNFKWTNIIILDTASEFEKPDFHHIWLIKRDDLGLYNYKSQDSIIKHINLQYVDSLLKNLSLYNIKPKDPLRLFGKDSLWIKNNAKKLWVNSRQRIKKIKKFDKYVIEALSNSSLYSDKINQNLKNDWNTDRSMIISFINEKDTLTIESYNETPFMLPWTINEEISYNRNISTLVSKILPDIESSSKNLLANEPSEQYIFSKFYHSYLSNKVNYLEALNKYPMRFKKIEKHFYIKKAELLIMASIDWSNWGSKCLELELIDKNGYENVTFTSVFGRRFFLHPINPIIRKRKKLIKQIENNPLFKYLIENDSSSAEIKFVNRRSFSKYAKKNFNEDAELNNLDKKIYKGKLRTSIFFVLSENQGKGYSSYARFIILKNGKIILWDISGSFRNAPLKDISTKQGYVCKHIDL